MKAVPAVLSELPVIAAVIAADGLGGCLRLLYAALASSLTPSLPHPASRRAPEAGWGTVDAEDTSMRRGIANLGLLARLAPVAMGAALLAGNALQRALAGGRAPNGRGSRSMRRWRCCGRRWS